MQKVLTILLTFILLSSFQFAQEKKILTPDGKITKYNGDLKNFEIISLKKQKSGIEKITHGISGNIIPLEGGAIDTLIPPGPYAANSFVFYDQDWMVQWYVSPANINIRQVGFSSTGNDAGTTVEVKVVKLNWTYEELLDAPVVNRGYYEATGNGFRDITAFASNPDATGGWVSIDGSPEPFASVDLWSDGGLGFPIVPTVQTSPTTYDWVDLSVLGYPTLQSGEIFGIALKHTGLILGNTAAGVTFYYGDMDIGGWKYYANGRLTTDDIGWWTREFTWDFVAEVEYTSDVPPSINSVTVLPSGTDLGPFPVDANITDTNPIGTAGVASAYINFSVDGGATWDSVAMSGTEPLFSGQIPAQSGGVRVEYYISATDVGGLFSSSPHASFYIFAPTPGVTTLVIYNGFSATEGYPQNWYFGPDIQGGTAEFAHDSWAYGPLSAGVLDTYTDVFEICNGEPADYNDDVVRAWLAASGTHNYYLEGQEWLGLRYSYADMDFVAGDFEFDILGINHSYNDVSYDGTSGQAIPSLVWAEAGSLFGQPLLTLFNSYSPLPDSLMFNPTFEGNIGDLNWIDGYEVESDVEVDVRVETRGVGGVATVDTFPTASHRTLSAGNKIFFAAYWTNYLNTAVSNAYPYYNWVGFTNENSPYQALLWFGVPINPVDVKEVGGNLPQEFSISQNYPNPFNPTTKINFSVPNTSFVKLKVYDVLGKEVATLVNQEMNSGNYVIDFDASSLASGLYIYKIQAGSFSTSRKMMLMK